MGDKTLSYHKKNLPPPPKGATFWELFDYIWDNGVGQETSENGEPVAWSAAKLESALDHQIDVRSIENWRSRKYMPTRENIRKLTWMISGGDQDLRQAWSEALIAEWKEIDASVAKLNMPFFYVAGNHDIGDSASLEVWRERLGPTYYHFVYKDVLFLCMDTDDPPQAPHDWELEGIAKVQELKESHPEQANSLKRELLTRVKEDALTGKAYVAAFSDTQIDYFKEVIANHPDVRWTFLFVHRPVWQASPQSEMFKEIEAALADRRYTVFSGHAHTYEHQLRQGMDYIRLSTTGGTWMLDPPGNFDHVAWVTMTDKGPVVANITLDGIFDKTGERKPVRGSFQ